MCVAVVHAFRVWAAHWPHQALSALTPGSQNLPFDTGAGWGGREFCVLSSLSFLACEGGVLYWFSMGDVLPL